MGIKKILLIILVVIITFISYKFHHYRVEKTLFEKTIPKYNLIDVQDSSPINEINFIDKFYINNLYNRYSDFPSKKELDNFIKRHSLSFGEYGYNYLIDTVTKRVRLYSFSYDKKDDSLTKAVFNVENGKLKMSFFDFLLYPKKDVLLLNKKYYFSCTCNISNCGVLLFKDEKLLKDKIINRKFKNSILEIDFNKHLPKRDIIDSVLIFNYNGKRVKYLCENTFYKENIEALEKEILNKIKKGDYEDITFAFFSLSHTGNNWW